MYLIIITFTIDQSTVTAQLRWCNSGSQGKLDGRSVRWAFLSGNIRVVVPFAARSLKRQKFVLKVAVYCIRRQNHRHEVAPKLIRHFNLDELINRRIKSVKRRILTSPAAKDVWKFTGVEVTCIQSQQINLESRAVTKCVCTRQSA
jgi:hypothetical protein